MPVSVLPFDSHPVGMPVQGRQRYWDGDVLGFDATPIAVVTPAVVSGFRFNLEGFQVATLYVTVLAGGGATVRVEIGMYDLNDTTLLRTDLLSAGVAVGATTALDFGVGAITLLRGRVFRVHNLRLARSAAGGADPVVTTKLYARS